MADVQAVIFDMDGVIFDSERICAMAWQSAAPEFAMQDVEASLRACTGMNRHDTGRYLLRVYGADFPVRSFLDRTSVLFREYVAGHGLPLKPCVRETLEYLKRKGYVIALASSTRRALVVRQLRQAGLIDYFATLTCGDEVLHSKPEPDIYVAACGSIARAAGVCVAVEDSPNGVLSAYRAGLLPVMVPDRIAPDSSVRACLFRLCGSLMELADFL